MWIIFTILSSIVLLVACILMQHVYIKDARLSEKNVDNYKQRINSYKHKISKIKRNNQPNYKDFDYSYGINACKNRISRIKYKLSTLHLIDNWFQLFICDPAKTIVPICLITIAVCMGFISLWNGYRDYSIIPQQQVVMRYKEDNAHHYLLAMKNSHTDEKSELRSNGKLTGNIGKPKDNTVWQKNYHKYFMAKSWHHFYKVEIQYEQHPLHNLHNFFYISHVQRFNNPTSLK